MTSANVHGKKTEVYIPDNNFYAYFKSKSAGLITSTMERG